MKRVLLFLVCVATVSRPCSAQIPVDRLQILNSPDVRAWTPTATITNIEFWRGAGIHFEFDRESAWPDVVPDGWNGPVQYTVWILLQIDGAWYGSGVIESWRDRPSTDDADVTADDQIARNWLYDGRWGPMRGHQPRAGERVGFMLTAGDARGRDVHGVAERTRIVEIAWPASSGSVVPFRWTEGDAPQPPPAPPPQPAPPAPLLPAIDLSPVLAQLDALHAAVDRLAQDEAAFHARVHDVWEKAGGVFLKYIAPVLAAFFGGQAAK